MVVKISQKQKDPLDSFVQHNIEKNYSIFSERTDPYFIINMDGQIGYANEACLLTLGYSKDEFVHMKLKDICSITDLNKNQTYFIKDDRSKLTSFYLEITKKDGDSIHVDATSFPIFLDNGVIGNYIVFRDAQELIVQREKHHNSLVEHSPEPILIVREDTIINVSNVALKMFDANTKDQLIGKSIYDFVDCKSVEFFTEKLNCVMSGEITDLHELTMLTVHRTELDVEIKAFPTVYRGERVSHLVIKDISERKKLSIISEKQAVAGQLAAGIAHEIRNPITAIKGFLQLIMDEEQKQISYFKIIESEIERIELILKELMVLAKPSSLRCEKLNIQRLLDQVLTLMGSQALLNDIEVIRKYNLSSIDIFGDENQLKQVFINYIKNAIESMPNGGKLIIEGFPVDNKSVCIRIVDQGCGIPPEIRERLGEPFLTTKENGTGLGMIVSNQIIKEHSGSINIISGQDGTCIEVYLPMYT